MRTRGYFLLLSIMLVLLGVLQYKLWFAPQGVLTLLKLKQEYSNLAVKNTKLQLHNSKLADDINKLHKITNTESRARQELGMIQKGEVFYHENIIK